MTPDQLAAIRARLGRATPGPWAWADVHAENGTAGPDTGRITADFLGGGPDLIPVVEGDGGDYGDRGWVVLCGADAAFIAAARTDIPALLDEIDRLRGLLLDVGLDEDTVTGEWYVDTTEGRLRIDEG